MFDSEDEEEEKIPPNELEDLKCKRRGKKHIENIEEEEECKASYNSERKSERQRRL